MTSQEEPWTVGRLLSWTIEYLGKHGADNPRLDAEVLLAHARGCRRIDLYAAFGEPATEETRTAFRELVKRRAAGTPVAYLVGHREFYSLDFEVNPDVLIPRPETELLVVALLDRVKKRADNADPDRHCRRRHRQRHPCRVCGQVCADSPSHGDRYQSGGFGGCQPECREAWRGGSDHVR